MGNGMIGMIIILLGLIMHQIETIIVKNYGKKHGQGGMFFNAIICLFAMIYFFITDKNGLLFPKGIWIYGIVNSIMYATGFYTGYAAYKTGSFGFTKLFVSFSAIFSIFYGIIFLKEPTSVIMYIAIAMIFLSVFLMNYQKDGDSGKNKISVKWIIYIILTVLSNAFISIIGRMQYGVYGDTYKNEFLIISLAGGAISLLILGAILERDSFKYTVKHGFLYGAGAGVCNGINNLLLLVAYNYLPISFISPVRTGIGIILGFIISILLYKERFTRRQLISAGIGIAAVILMNL